MSVIVFTVILLFGSYFAGLLGSLTGLGGGFIIIPLLTLLLGVDLHYAIGASLVSVIATSSGSAAAYVKEGFSNIRIGMFLEIATTLGALLGAYLTAKIPPSAIAIVFGLMLIYSAYVSRRTRPRSEIEKPPDPLATKLKMNSTFPDTAGLRSYNVYGVPAGFGIMFGAGT